MPVDPSDLWAALAEEYEVTHPALRDRFIHTRGPMEGQLMITPERVDEIFTYHPPKSDQIPRYEDIRNAARKLAHFILENTPASPEQTTAIRKLQEAVMWANNSIAVNE